MIEVSTKTELGLEFDEEMFAVAVALGAGIPERSLLYLIASAQLLARVDQRDGAEVAESRLVRLQLATDQDEAIDLIREVAAYVAGVSMNPCCVDDCGTCHGCKMWQTRKDEAKHIQDCAEHFGHIWKMLKDELVTCAYCTIRLPEPGIAWGRHKKRFHPELARRDEARWR